MKQDTNSIEKLIEEAQSCKSNAPLNMKQDTSSIEKIEK